MTQKEILEYNKRCAEFLGAELYTPKPWYHFPKYREHYYFKDRYEPNRFTFKMLKFHSDWNWIMEILIKIQSLPLDQYTHKIYNLKFRESKEQVLEAINQFLIWYNETKS